MEKKNNGVIIILMGIIIVILMVLCILFATDTIKFNYKIKDVNKKNNTEVEKSNDESTKDYCEKIVGDYIFEEEIDNSGDINGITSASYIYNLSVNNDENECKAVLEVNGFQTYSKIDLKIEYKKEKYNFLFDKYSDENAIQYDYDESYNAGDILFSLYNKNNQLYTSWGNYMPKVESNKGDNIYFKKL